MTIAIKSKKAFLLMLMAIGLSIATSIISWLDIQEKIKILLVPSGMPLYGLICSFAVICFICNYKNMEKKQWIIGLQILMAIFFLIEIAGMFVQINPSLVRAFYVSKLLGMVVLIFLTPILASQRTNEQGTLAHSETQELFEIESPPSDPLV